VQYVSDFAVVDFPGASRTFRAHGPCSGTPNLEENMLLDLHGIEYDPSKLEPFHDIFFHEKGVVYVIGNWETTNHSVTPPFSLDIHNTNSPRTFHT
jgi:hypothetical protein